MLRTTYPSAAAFLLLAATAGSAAADCSTEVQEAVKKQTELKSFRMESNVISENGPLKITIDYVLPDRMRHVAVPASDPSPLETILIGDQAWANAGGGWQVVPDEEVQFLISQMKAATTASEEAVGDYDCIGTETVEGRQLRGYRGLPPKVKGLKKPDGTPMRQTTQNDAIRIVYIDPDSGLPARSIYARADQLDKPIFKEVYSYPKDISIEPPEKVEAPPAGGDQPSEPKP
jgi:hypothetical protein